MNPKETINTIQIQTINVCNAKCNMCPHPDYFLKKEIMELDKVQELMERIKPLHLKRIVPFFENEPLADKGLFEKMAMMNRYFPNVYMDISTNLLVFNQDVKKNLLKAPVDRVVVSFHGHDRETYKQNMGVDQFDRVLDHLEQLREVHSERCRVVMNSYGQGVDKQAYYKLFENFPYEIFVAQPNTRGGDSAEKLGRDKLQKERTVGCRFRNRPHEWLHFRANGDVILCCMDYGQRTLMGNIFSQTLDELFSSEKYQRIINQSDGKDQPSDFICRQCEYGILEADRSCAAVPNEIPAKRSV